MNDQQWIKYTAITSRQTKATLILARNLSFNCQKVLSGPFTREFWFIFRFIKVESDLTFHKFHKTMRRKWNLLFYKKKTTHTNTHTKRGNNAAVASINWRVWRFEKSINFANCNIKMSFPEEQEICWGQHYAANQTDDLLLSLLSAQTSKVRGFGQHDVGGTNSADPCGLPTLISVWSALHYLEENRQAPHYTNESTSVEILSLQTACLFLSASWLLIICFFNCGGGPLLFNLQRKASQGLPQC